MDGCVWPFSLGRLSACGVPSAIRVEVVYELINLEIFLGLLSCWLLCMMYTVYLICCTDCGATEMRLHTGQGYMAQDWSVPLRGKRVM